MTLAKNLRILRSRKRISQIKLSQILDISRSKLNAYENGVSEPAFATLIKLSEFYNVSVDDLIKAKASVSDETDAFVALTPELHKQFNEKLLIFADGQSCYANLMASKMTVRQRKTFNDLLELLGLIIKNNHKLYDQA